MVESLESILRDDGYRRLRDSENVVPGDLVLYRKDEIFEHVGVVFEIRRVGQLEVPYVMSKWGPGPEYLHPVARSPYGQDYEFCTERP